MNGARFCARVRFAPEYGCSAKWKAHLCSKTKEILRANNITLSQCKRSKQKNFYVFARCHLLSSVHKFLSKKSRKIPPFFSVCNGGKFLSQFDARTIFFNAKREKKNNRCQEWDSLTHTHINRTRNKLNSIFWFLYVVCARALSASVLAKIKVL